jgi:hypothetical protein
MRVLLFITSHRQVKEYEYSAYFFNRLEKLNKICDIYIYCNNPDISEDILKYYKQFNIKNKKIFITNINDGYYRGGMEVMSIAYDNNVFKDYDYVIHCHPDVFITDDEYLMQILNDNYENDYIFLMTFSFPDNKTFLSGDIFIFKPKLLKENIFKDTLSLFLSIGIPAEVHNYNMFHKHNIKYLIIKRFKDDNCNPRRISEYLKDWHEHDLTKVEDYINNKESPINNKESPINILNINPRIKYLLNPKHK